MRTAATLFTLCGLLVQQAAQPPQQPQRPPVFRGEAVLVTVDAYPHRDGVIVTGLQARDFEILEDGKPQTVEHVEFVRVEPTLSESERRDPNSTREMLAQVADPRNRVFIIFLDHGNTSLGGSHWMRRPLIDALNRIIGERDLFAVATAALDPRAMTFGRRVISIEEQLTKYWYWGERTSAMSDQSDPMEEVLRRCYSVDPETGKPWTVPDNGQSRYLYRLLWDRRREDRALTALEDIVERLASMREARTAAIVVTEGWRQFGRDAKLADEAKKIGPVRPRIGVQGGRLTTADPSSRPGGGSLVECQTELVRLADLENDRRIRELTGRANRANVSFYPINPLGMPVSDSDPSETSQPSLAEDHDRLRRRSEGLLTLANATDGIAIVANNDLAVGLRRIADDVSAYYLLGYYSTNTMHDGKYRRIEVKTKAPGIRTRARRGYYAPANKPVREVPAPSAAIEPPAGLEQALGELGRIRTSADAYIRGTLAGDRALIAVELSSSRAALAPWTNGATIQVVVTPPGAVPAAPVTARLDAGVRGALISVPLGAQAGAASAARVLATISAGGETLEETAEIRRVAAAPLIADDAVVYRGRPAATSPLRAVADLQFRRTERVHVEWLVSAELDRRSARLLGRSGQPLAVPVTVTEREADGRKVVVADLNLAPLGAGDYVLELTVGRGAEATTRLIAFRVVP